MAKQKRAPRFTRPGRGVDKNAKPKNAFFRFFELLISRISKLVVFNIMYFICILPIICAVITFGSSLFNVPAELVSQTVFFNWMMRLSFWLPTPISFALLAISIIFYGPITCGFSYAMRNFVSGRHAWYSDMFSRAMKNFKQGLVLGLIDILVVVCVALYVATDFSVISGGMYYMYTAFRIIAVIVAIFYVFMRYYLYNLAITFDLPLNGIFKNAYIFGVLGFGRNILTTVLSIITLIAFTSTVYIDVFLMATFAFSFCGFLSNFATYPVIKKYMIDVQEKEDSKETEKVEAE